MRPDCINSVETAIGRTLRAGEATDIEQRITQAMRSLAAEDRAAWVSMSQADKLASAGQRVGVDLLATLAKKQQRAALDVMAAKRLQDEMARNPSLSPLHVLNRLLVAFNDGKSYIQSIDAQAKAIADIAKSDLLGLIDATRGKWLGLRDDVVMNQDIVRELHGTDTGNGTARMAAKAFHDVANGLRERFNRAGGEVGKLDDWAMPHSHSVERTAKAGRDKWVQDVLPMVNRDKYVNDDGSLMTDQQVVEFLNEAYVSIATNGANKIEAGKASSAGKRANRGSEARVMHFRDGDAWLEYQAKYGDQDLMNVLLSHVDGMARDIALIERLGSNPNQMFAMFLDNAEKSQKMGGENPNKVDALRHKTEVLFSEVTKSNVPASVSLSLWFSAYRSLMVSARLGSAMLAAVTDIATNAMTSRQNGLAYSRVFGAQMRLLNPMNAADREIARSVGLGIDEMLASIARYTDDGLGTTATWAGRAAKYSTAAASAVMRSSVLSAWTAAGKQGFSMMLMNKYGQLSRTMKWADLDSIDRNFLEQTGLTELDWSIWQKATPLDRGNGTLILSARDIMAIPDAELQGLGADPITLKEQAATRYMAHILDEQGMAVIEAGARERAKLYGSLKKGTVQGEIWRSMMQFKSFTAALMMRHGARMMGKEGAWGKAAYGVPLFVMSSLLGGLVVQLRQLASGNDPEDMTAPSFYANAILAGGTLGVYGDIMKAGIKPDGRGLTDLAAGPIGGEIQSIGAMIGGNAAQWADGKDTKASAEAIKMVKTHTPFANLWYTKAATDRLIFNQLQELAQPGLLDRQAARQRRLYDRTAWWATDEVVPDRAPDFEKAVGNK